MSTMIQKTIMLKIFLLTKNETKLVEDWIKYHGYLFGLENIHILDGSVDEYILEVYAKYKPLGLNVHFSSAGLNDLSRELTQLMHEHKGNDSFLIKLDTDEFLAYTFPFIKPFPDPFSSFLQKHIGFKKGMGGVTKRLIGLLTDRKCANKKIHVENIRQLFDALPVTGQRYKASLTTWSLPTVDTPARPCHSLTQFTPLHFTHIKSFFHSASFVSVDLGCHNGKSTRCDGLIDTGLTLVHYHSTSVEDAIRSARQVLLSHEYIDEDDLVIEQRQKLMGLRPSDRRASSFHKIDLYLRHLDFLDGGNAIDPATLYMHNPYFRQPGNPIEFTLVRDTLNEIDRQKIF